jgi:hypothetical protein
LSDDACKAQLLLLAAHKRFPLRADDCGRTGSARFISKRSHASEVQEFSQFVGPPNSSRFRFAQRLRGGGFKTRSLRLRGPQLRPTKQNLVSMSKVVSDAWEVAVIRGAAALVAV